MESQEWKGGSARGVKVKGGWHGRKEVKVVLERDIKGGDGQVVRGR